MGRGVADARLRVWAPQGARCCSCARSRPTIEDLTDRGRQVRPLIRDFPTGSWGDECRDYHVAVRVPAEAARCRAARGTGPARRRRRGRRARAWCRRRGPTTPTLTTRINPAVAHYTGQAELADAIQEGLAAKAAGDDAHRDLKLGRAAKLAAETGNDEATNKLKRVVDIDDAETGTVRLKRDVVEARRDGARHQLDQDDPGELMTPVPARPHVEHRRLLRRVRRAHRCRARPPRRPPPPAAPAGSAPRPPAGGSRRRVPELRRREPGRRAVLRGVRLRLHHGPAPGPAAHPTELAEPPAPTASAPVAAAPAPAIAAGPMGRGALDRPRLVLGADRPPAPARRAAHRRSCRSPVPRALIGRKSVEPGVEPGHRLRQRRRHLAPPRPDHPRPGPMVDRGSRLDQRHVRREARRHYPTDPLTANQPRQLADDDRIYLGAWTRVVVRRATADEKAGKAP